MEKISTYTKILIILFAGVLTVSSWNIIHNFPVPDDYFYNADEGTYFRQAKTIKDSGKKGYAELAHSYIGNETEQLLPSPIRVAYSWVASWFLRLEDSIRSLSYFSLVSYILLCLISFLFFRHIWDEKVAFFCATLMCLSPLAQGLAGRALLDTSYYLFSSAALFSFFLFVKKIRPGRFILFISLLTLSILIKETTLFLLPFFAGTLFFLRINNKAVSWKYILLTALLPPLLGFFTLVFCFGSSEKVMAVFRAMYYIYEQNIAAPNTYVLAYNSGPWYEYLVDYFLLSPVVSILFFLYAGYYLFSPSKNVTTTLLILFFVYFILFFTFLPKNLRFAINLDFIYILFSGLCVTMLIDKWNQREAVKRAAFFFALAVLLFFNFKSYKNYFIESKIYDPVAYNLLQAEKFIPSPTTDLTTLGAEEAVSQAVDSSFYINAIHHNPTKENYLRFGIYYHYQGNYEKAIELYQKAIAINPEFYEAYNSLGAAYSAMQQWEKAIQAIEKSLQINPRNQSAINNLEWAKSQLAKTKAAP
jgi:tetratricopeptide (TPR) repeat protein